jgi:hypothetical protein
MAPAQQAAGEDCELGTEAVRSPRPLRLFDHPRAQDETLGARQTGPGTSMMGLYRDNDGGQALNPPEVSVGATGHKRLLHVFQAIATACLRGKGRTSPRLSSEATSQKATTDYHIALKTIPRPNDAGTRLSSASQDKRQKQHPVCLVQARSDIQSAMGGGGAQAQPFAQGSPGASLRSTDEKQRVEVGPQPSATSILGRIKDYLTLGILAAAAVWGRCFVNESALVVNSVSDH